MQKIDEAIALLEKIEWIRSEVERDSYASGCNICGALEEFGHSSNCELAQAIAKLREAPNLWLIEDYLKKALNRWDIDGKRWVESALQEIKVKAPEPTEFTERLRNFIKMYENEVPRRAEITFLGEACAVIEQLKAELAKKES